MDSIEDIYKQHAKTVYGFLLVKTQNQDLAEELTQETFYQAIRSIHRFEGKCSISTWLCAIAKNQLNNYYKDKKHNEVQIEEAIEISVPSAEDRLLHQWSKVEIMKLLHKLKEPMREVMYLRLSGDLSFREIGDILGQSENWARVTYYRGKEKIIQEVNENEL